MLIVVKNRFILLYRVLKERKQFRLTGPPVWRAPKLLEMEVMKSYTLKTSIMNMIQPGQPSGLRIKTTCGRTSMAELIHIHV